MTMYMAVPLYLAVLFRALIVLMWTPAFAFAAVLATTGADNSPLNIPLSMLVATMFISTLSGATTLALRIVSELRADPPKPLVHPWPYCIAHMFGSWLAGTLFFLLGMAQGAGVWLLLAMVLVSSFGGAKVLELAAERWLPTTLPKGAL